MSIHALAWVFDQDIRPSWLKFTLVAFADCANEKNDMLCWPSIAHVCAVTSQDRKTVINCIDELVNRGWLVDTNERRGKTKQIKVYMLCLPKGNSAVDGTVKESRPAEVRVPSTEGKESRPRDTEPLSEPLIKQARGLAVNKNVDKKWRDTTSRNPETSEGEVLPYDWCSYAEAKSIPDDQIYRSWERFKAVSVSPWQRERWHRWVDRERVSGEKSLDHYAD